jgi:hypothetical protein
LFNWDLAVQSTARCAIVLRRFCKSDRPTRSGARAAWAHSAFLLLAFLSAYFAKEKRLKSLGIKG